MMVLRLFALLLAVLTISSPSTVNAQNRTGYSSAPKYSLTFDQAPNSANLATTLNAQGGFDWVSSSQNRQGLAFFNRLGRNYIDVANFTDNLGRTFPQFSGEVSFEIWLMQRDVASWQRAWDFAVGSQFTNPISDDYYLGTAESGNARFQYQTQGTSGTGTPGTATTSIFTNGGTGRYGEWVHIVCTTAMDPNPANTQGGFSVIYANAVNLTQGQTYVPRAVTRQVNWLGRSAYAANNDPRMHGFVDSFYFYDYPLSAEAVYAHLQVSRVPVFELTFSVNIATLTGAASPTYSWLANDGPRNLGLVRLSGSSQSINLNTATGASSAGTSLPTTIGGATPGSPPNAGSSFETIVKFFGLTNGASIFDLNSGASRIRLSLNAANNIVFSAGSVTVTSSSVAATGIFYHIAAVITPTSGGQGTYTLYINGVSVGTATGATLTSTTYTSAFLGQSTDTTPVYLNAEIDAFRIYDIALTMGEVSGLYNTIVSPPSGFNPAEPPTYDVVSPSGPLASFTFSQPMGAFGSAGLSNYSYLAQDDDHIGIAVFDGQLNALDLSDFADDYNVTIPTFFGGAVSFEAKIQFLNNANQAMVWSFSGIAGLIDNNVQFMNTYWQDGNDVNSLVFQTYGDASYDKSRSTYCHGCTNGQWKHVIVTVAQPNINDNSSSTSALLSMYIDGVFISSSYGFLPQYIYRPNLWLAKSPWVNGDASFFGNIDTFAFYDYALSAEQVSAHYTLSIPPQYELAFALDPRINARNTGTANYGWAAIDGVHEGLLTLAGTNFVDLSATSGNNFIGFSPIGNFGNNRNTPGVAANLANGLAFDIVFKAISTSAGSTLFDITANGGGNAVNLAFTSTGLFFSAGGQSINCGQVSANVWTHVLVSITPDTVGFAAQCYLNGVRQVTLSNFPAIPMMARPMAMLGKSNTAANSNFNGQIDAFRVHNTAITSDIAQNLARAYSSRNAYVGPPALQSGPVVSYTFDKPPQAFTDPTNADTYNYYSWLLNPTGIAASSAHQGVAVFAGVGNSNALRQYIDLNFDQDAYGRTMPQYYGGSMSFEVWVNMHRLQGWQRVFDIGDNSNTGWNNANGAGQFNIILSCNGDNPPKFHFENYYNVSQTQAVDIAGGWNVGAWQHVVVSIDMINSTTATLVIYSNTQEIARRFIIPPPVEMRRLAWLGRSNWDDSAFNGTLDSFYFYNYGLSAAQVALHYNLPNPPMFDAPFETNPSALANTSSPVNYGWSAVDGTDNTHTGVLTLNGNSQFVDLSVTSGVNSIGQAMSNIAGLSVGINQNGWSIETSVKFASLTGTSKVFDIGNGAGVDSIALGNVGQNVYFYVNNGITDDSTVVPLFKATANTFYHVIVVVTPGNSADSATYTVYVSGQQRTTVTGFSVPAIARRSAFIGRSNIAGESMFSGSVDTLRYYNYALNSAGVTYLASVAGSSGQYSQADNLAAASSSTGSSNNNNNGGSTGSSSTTTTNPSASSSTGVDIPPGVGGASSITSSAILFFTVLSVIIFNFLV